MLFVRPGLSGSPEGGLARRQPWFEPKVLESGMGRLEGAVVSEADPDPVVVQADDVGAAVAGEVAGAAWIFVDAPARIRSDATTANCGSRNPVARWFTDDQTQSGPTPTTSAWRSPFRSVTKRG